MSTEEKTREFLKENNRLLFEKYKSLVFLYTGEISPSVYHAVIGYNSQKDFSGEKENIKEFFQERQIDFLIKESDNSELIPNDDSKEYQKNLNEIIQPGRSIANPNLGLIGTGTLGGILTVESFDRPILITCDHVLKLECNVGASIIVPGRDDGGSFPDDKAASYIGRTYDEYVDVAFSELDENKIKEYKEVTTCGYLIEYDSDYVPQIGDSVFFCRKLHNSNSTNRKVLGNDCTVDINGNIFYDQIVIEKKSNRGQSGSIAVSRDNSEIHWAAGLVFGRDRKADLTYLNKMKYVLQSLSSLSDINY